jgi:ribosome-binding factor A
VSRGDRLGELFRQIIAEELERIDHEDLSLVSVTNVEVDGNLSKAVIGVSNLEPADDDDVLKVLESLRPRLQKAVGTQTRVRRVPPFKFMIDNVLRSAERIDDILRGIDTDVADTEAVHDGD